ncbi:glycosyltransferase [Methylobacterium sp. WL103]|uniref:glycosyltransferase n=1 Tax=Methylobacterium sp. WL103 TaxID=2603891 RepID=UPI0011CA3889|nr:glycosyltransferase [Methylobacterium sp. WL103]TXN07167.1 glycosyltransferase [Methylobacterium sp. WL103]
MIQVLFVHQNFPGQFGPIVEALREAGGFRLAAIGRRLHVPQGISYYPYTLKPVVASGSSVVDSLTQRVAAAESVAEQGRQLKQDGFKPDVIVVHAGWGEGLFLRNLFPQARIVCYCEYYYGRIGSDLTFDPEFLLASDDVLHRLRGANALSLATMDDADICVAPTAWQKSTFPAEFGSKIAVLHEGIDIDALGAGKARPMRFAQTGIEIAPGSPVVTYVARSLEPYRGFHTFMRSLPMLLAQETNVQVLIIGKERGGYGPSPPDGRTWRQVFSEELGGRLDPARTHFLGWVSREVYANCLRLSRVHAYLTYPFVLSWSLLEAMAAGCAIVASDTAPVREVLQDRQTARLVDFFQPADWAGQIRELLHATAQRQQLGMAARHAVIEQGLTRKACAARWLELIRSLAGRT